MSGPFHMRAVCDCGWSGQCPTGDVDKMLDAQRRRTDVCPACGEDRTMMSVMVGRWHEGAWRDRDGVPLNGVEPEPEPVTHPLRPFFRNVILPNVVLALAVAAVVAWVMTR